MKKLAMFTLIELLVVMLLKNRNPSLRHFMRRRLLYILVALDQHITDVSACAIIPVTGTI